MPPAFPQAQRRSTDIVRYSLLPEPVLYRKKTTSENTSPVQALCIKLWHPAIALHTLSATSCGQYPQSGLARLRHVDISVKCPWEYADTFLYFLPSTNSPDVHWHFSECLRCTAAPAPAPAPLPGASRPRSEPDRRAPFFRGSPLPRKCFEKRAIILIQIIKNRGIPPFCRPPPHRLENRPSQREVTKCMGNGQCRSKAGYVPPEITLHLSQCTIYLLGETGHCPRLLIISCAGFGKVPLSRKQRPESPKAGPIFPLNNLSGPSASVRCAAHTAALVGGPRLPGPLPAG